MYIVLGSACTFWVSLELSELSKFSMSFLFCFLGGNIDFVSNMCDLPCTTAAFLNSHFKFWTAIWVLRSFNIIDMMRKIQWEVALPFSFPCHAGFVFYANWCCPTRDLRKGLGKGPKSFSYTIFSNFYKVIAWNGTKWCWFIYILLLKSLLVECTRFLVVLFVDVEEFYNGAWL